jgi:DNA-binding XRE family transcriptional regulator
MNIERRKGVENLPTTNQLRKLRKYHELTYQDMGNLIDVDTRTYINKETGVSQFKLNEMFIISKKFNKSMDEIFLPTNFMIHEVSEGKST